VTHLADLPDHTDLPDTVTTIDFTDANNIAGTIVLPVY
jgi:hypothetical protein